MKRSVQWALPDGFEVRKMPGKAKVLGKFDDTPDVWRFVYSRNRNIRQRNGFFGGGADLTREDRSRGFQKEGQVACLEFPAAGFLSLGVMCGDSAAISEKADEIRASPSGEDVGQEGEILCLAPKENVKEKRSC
jgi:hypothetical protein